MRAASIYSLVETAKLSGLHPQAYAPINRFDELLPWNIGGPHVEQRLTA